MFFSAKNFVENKLGINEALTNEVYGSPVLNLQNALYDGEMLEWTKSDDAKYYVVYQKSGKSEKVFCITSLPQIRLQKGQTTCEYFVFTVNRGNYESERSNVILYN